MRISAYSPSIGSGTSETVTTSQVYFEEQRSTTKIVSSTNSIQTLKREESDTAEVFMLLITRFFISAVCTVAN